MTESEQHTTGENPELLVHLIDGLRVAKEKHYNWLWDIHRSLLCQVPLENGTELDPNICGFAEWQHLIRNEPLFQDNPSYQQVCKQHLLMHQAAIHMVQTAQMQHPLPVAVYNDFITQRNRFKADIEHLERELWDLACLVDPLTGLRNRHGMWFELRDEQQRSRREGDCCSIAMVDIDHFKAINDEHGHSAGDMVLQQVARLMKKVLRPYDRIYRYGGEEFLVCLPGTTITEAVQIIERVRADLAVTPMQNTGEALYVTASFGLATIAGKCNIEDYLEQADQALYEAKSAGRNCLRVYPGQDDQSQ